MPGSLRPRLSPCHRRLTGRASLPQATGRLTSSASGCAPSRRSTRRSCRRRDPSCEQSRCPSPQHGVRCYTGCPGSPSRWLPPACQVFSVHDLCVLRDEGGLADVFAARVTSRKVKVALDAYEAAAAAAAAAAPSPAAAAVAPSPAAAAPSPAAAAAAPSAAGTSGAAGAAISNRTGWLNVGRGAARAGAHTGPLGASAASIAGALSAAGAPSAAGAAGAAGAASAAPRRPSLRQSLSSPADKARVLLAEARSP